jgi:hypothetical protein
MLLKSSKNLRVTVDLAEADIATLKEVEELNQFASRREVYLTGARLLLQLIRARRAGYRPQIFDPKSQKTLEFSWEQLPQLRAIQDVRLLSADRIKDPTLRQLISIARELQDIDLERVAAMIAQATWDPSGASGVEDGIIADLIVICLSKRDDKLTAVVRDVLTQMVTTFGSFDEMLAEAKHGYRPGLDTRFREQRFLDAEYIREINRRYPKESAALRQQGVI